MSEITNKEERAIRCIISSAMKSYANGFSMRHLAEVNDENGVINMKKHNIFNISLSSDILYYSTFICTLNCSLENLLKTIAFSIAALNYEVSRHVEGTLYKEQTDYITEHMI